MPQIKRRTAMVGSALLLILATVSPLVAAPLAQEPYEVEVAQVDLSDYPRITIYVTVRDAEGRPVEGLGRSDFHILEGQGQARIEEFAGLGQQRPVDIVFVLDTTGSMGSHIQMIKETIISFAETLEGRHRDYRLGLVTYGDDVRESHTFTNEVALFSDWIEAQDADGGGNEPENALGGLQQAAGFPFRAEAQRLILLITDAPLHEYGDGPDSDVSFDDPLLTVEATAARLAAASVSVYGVTPGMSDYVDLAEQTGGQIYSIYDDLGQIVDNLGTAIANQYRITYRAPRAVFDGSWQNVQVSVGRIEGTASYRTPSERPPGASSVDLYNTLPTPLQISTDPAVVGTNLGLAILLALLFGLTSTIFNDTLNEHQDEIEHSLVGRFFSALKAIGGLLIRPFQALTFRGRRAGAYVQVVAFLVVTAFIACFLDPSYRPLSWAGLGLFSSMLLSIGLVNLVYEGSQITAARRFDLEAVLKLNPIGVAVGPAFLGTDRGHGPPAAIAGGRWFRRFRAGCCQWAPERPVDNLFRRAGGRFPGALPAGADQRRHHLPMEQDRLGPGFRRGLVSRLPHPVHTGERLPGRRSQPKPTLAPGRIGPLLGTDRGAVALLRPAQRPAEKR
jgi:VWFA-related protein